MNIQCWDLIKHVSQVCSILLPGLACNYPTDLVYYLLAPGCPDRGLHFCSRAPVETRHQNVSLTEWYVSRALCNSQCQAQATTEDSFVHDATRVFSFKTILFSPQSDPATAPWLKCCGLRAVLASAMHWKVRASCAQHRTAPTHTHPPDMSNDKRQKVFAGGNLSHYGGVWPL